MFKKALFAFALLLILTGTANADPLRNFSGPAYMQQTAEFLNNISRNWSDLPLGNIILTYILQHGGAHKPTIIFQNKQKDIMLLISKRKSIVYLAENCTFFSIRISNESGEKDSQFSTFLCLSSSAQTASLRIKYIDYRPITQ